MAPPSSTLFAVQGPNFDLQVQKRSYPIYTTKLGRSGPSPFQLVEAQNKANVATAPGE